MRFRRLEEKANSYGRYLASDIETYQATRISDLHLPEIGSEREFKWRQINVPWDKSKYLKTKAITVCDNKLVVGLLGEVPGSAAIYIFDGKRWEFLGSDETKSKWTNFNYVQDLSVHKGRLYAGINNSVWVFEKSRGWKTVGQGESGFPWNADLAYSILSHKEHLYLGVLGSSNVYRLVGSKWERVSNGLNRFAGHGIYELWSHSDGKLYATLAADYKSTVVFALDEKNSQWKAVGGEGINGSWISNGFRYGLSMSSYYGYLIVTMNRHPQVEGNFSSIWAFDGNEWYPLGNSNAPIIWGKLNNFNASISFKGVLIVGAGGHPAGNASVWALDQVQWVPIGGYGINNSWGRSYSHTLTDSFRHAVAEYPYRFVEWNNSVVVGFGDTLGAATLWQLKID